MARNLNVGMLVYDSANCTDGMIKEVNDNKVTLINDWFNTWVVSADKLFVVDVDMSNKYNMLVCTNHTDKSKQPYFVPFINDFVGTNDLQFISRY